MSSQREIDGKNQKWLDTKVSIKYEDEDLKTQRTTIQRETW